MHTSNIINLIYKFLITTKSYGIIHSLFKTALFISKSPNKQLELVYAQNISLISMLSGSTTKAKFKAKQLIGSIFLKSYSINKNYLILSHKNNNFANQKVVLIAHWDPHNIIDPYVEYMAQKLKNTGRLVIICSANKNLILPTKNLFDAIISRTCDGYDFTSWKTAFTAFPTLYYANEITFCNDSVFGPIGSYNSVFKEMEQIKCDFWGLTLNTEIMPHIQSYFLVFRKKTICHYAFHQFIKSIPLDNSRNNAIKHELRLALWLELNNLIPGCYRPFSLKNKLYGNQTIVNWSALPQFGIPIIKRELFKSGSNLSMPSWKFLLDKFNYNSKYINEYFYRIGIDISPVLSIGHKSNTFPPSVFSREIKFSSFYLNNNKYVYNNLSSNKIKIGVFIHCNSYEDLNYIIKHLYFLSNKAYFFISTDSYEKKTIINNIIKKYNINANVEVFTNHACYISSFICGFKSKIKNFEIILKLHTSNSYHLYNNNYNKIKSLIYTSLLGNEKHIKYIIELLYQHKEIGMLLPPTFPSIIVEPLKDISMQKILEKMKINIPFNEAIDFPVGSMFWSRSEALKHILDLNFKFEDFDQLHFSNDYNLAHIIEKLFLFSCCKAGFYWGRIAPTPYGILGAI